MAKQVLPPGSKSPDSGIKEIVGPRGGRTGNERTVVKGEPLPPTPRPGQGYIDKRPAHNGAGTGKRK